MSKWKKITKRCLPPEGEPVWLYQKESDSGERLWIGAREWCDDDGGFWLYGITRDVPSHMSMGGWGAIENEWDDDYKPTHWMPLPEPPSE